MSALPRGYQYRGHSGFKARKRLMRQSLRKVERLRDHATHEALERVRAATADEPDTAELGMLHLTHVALQASQEVSRNRALRNAGPEVTWAEAVNHLLDEFDERAQEAPVPRSSRPRKRLGRVDGAALLVVLLSVLGYVLHRVW